MADALINKAKVRQYAEAAVPQLRPGLVGKKTRFASSFFERIDARVRNIVRDEINQANSSGKTFQ